MKEYKNSFGRVVVETVREYNAFVRATVSKDDLIKIYKDTDPDMLYEVLEEGKNPLLERGGGYVVMATPTIMQHTPDGYATGEQYHQRDAKNEDDAIFRTKEQILFEIANGIPVDPFIANLFEEINIKVGLFF